MKLLSLFPSTIRGGAEEYVLTIASAAAKVGWDVHLAFPNTQGTTSLVEDFLARGISYHPLDIAEVGGRRLKAVREHIPQFLRTVALLIKLRPDVVQITLPWADRCLGSILACRLLKIPTAVVFQLIAHRFSFTDSRLKAYTWARTRHQQWIGISENNRQLICESFEIPQDQVLRIYNGTNARSDFINYNSDEVARLRFQVRQELGIPESSKLLLTVGRLHPQKGYTDLVPIIATIVSEFPEVKFIWVGDGEQRNYLVQKVREYGVESSVLFLGYRSDIPRFLKASDLFVFPTHYEGLPFTVIEAMAHGLPIITSDASSLPEVIEDKVQGLLSPKGNSQELLEAIRWALKHPESMQEMAQAAKMRVQEFSEDRMVEETLGLFKKLSHAA